MNNVKNILIADDSEMNRQILADILGGEYKYLYAADGQEAIEMLARGTDVDLMLLDINMPNMNGFKVLDIMERRCWLDEIPVIVISSESDTLFVRRAYNLGATDYIARPFDAAIVQRRVENILRLYTRQKDLVQMVETQVYEREKVSSTMINFLSHVIEFKNNESGAHILHVRTITNMLLHQLVKLTDKYSLSESDIAAISTLSALHDIGKIAIPDNILNKPGKLTAEEWEIMKKHSELGEALLNEVPANPDDPLVAVAYGICRWHHERWDGGGYPDGLAGDEIPISAQVVAMADVYDALTGIRCYKDAVPHDKAIEMICAGECGEFNPLLIHCLKNIAGKLDECLLKEQENFDYKDEAHRVAEEMLENKSLLLDYRTRRLLMWEQAKSRFYANICGGIQFEYDRYANNIVYTSWYEGDTPKSKLIRLSDGDDIELLSENDMAELRKRLKTTTREEPQITMNVLIPVAGNMRWHRLTAMTLWSSRIAEYAGVLGQLTDVHDELIKKERNRKLRKENYEFKGVL